MKELPKLKYKNAFDIWQGIPNDDIKGESFIDRYVTIKSIKNREKSIKQHLIKLQADIRLKINCQKLINNIEELIKRL